MFVFNLKLNLNQDISYKFYKLILDLISNLYFDGFHYYKPKIKKKTIFGLQDPKKLPMFNGPGSISKGGSATGTASINKTPRNFTGLQPRPRISGCSVLWFNQNDRMSNICISTMLGCRNSLIRMLPRRLPIQSWVDSHPIFYIEVVMFYKTFLIFFFEILH